MSRKSTSRANRPPVEARVGGRLRKLVESGLALAAETERSSLVRRIASSLRRLVDADRARVFLVERGDGGTASRPKSPPGGDDRPRYVLACEDAPRGGARVGARPGPRRTAGPAARRTRRRRVSLRGPRGETIGAIEVEARLVPEDEEFLRLFAEQAAGAIERVRLYEEIERTFEGLVESFTLSLEKRNRTTSGHSRRVAAYALAVAHAVSADPRRFGGFRFGPGELRELRWAALLHDIGKIGVPEAILDKRGRLAPAELRALEYRFAYWRERRLRERGVADRMARADAARLDRLLDRIRRMNASTSLGAEDRRALEELRTTTFVDVDGESKPILTDSELESLSVADGNLTRAEWVAMQRHIDDTREILQNVPWPRASRRVPLISASHHEKLDGSGYPKHLRGREIPLGGRILAIVDMFEALTAKERPYKPPIPASRAIEMVEDEVRRGRLDPNLFALFKGREIYRMFVDESGRIRPPADRPPRRA